MSQKTKGEHIKRAYEKARVSGLTINPSAEDNETALELLEDLMSEYEGRGICLSYSFEQYPDPSTASGVKSQFNEMIASNLAVRLLPYLGKGKEPDPMLLRQASATLSNAVARTAKVPKRSNSVLMGIGSGNRFSKHRTRFPAIKEAPISCKTIDIEVDITKSLSESWVDFLGDDVITAYTIESSAGIVLLSSAINPDTTGIDFTVTGKKAGWQKIIIQIVADASTPNKADERVINFNVTDNKI